MKLKIKKTAQRLIWLITILFVILLLLTLLLSTCDLETLKLDNAKKIVKLYHENEDLFNHAAETIGTYRQMKHLKVSTDEDDLRSAESVYVCRQFDGIYIISSEALKESEYLELCNAFVPLIAKLQDSGLRCGVYYDCVQFILEGPVYGRAAELFCSLDERENNPRVYGEKEDVLEIDSHWAAAIILY